MNDGRCGVTSMKPAARVQLSAKLAILLTPPTRVRESRRRAREDLGIQSAGVYFRGPRKQQTFVFADQAPHLQGLTQSLPVAESQPRETLQLHRIEHSGGRQSLLSSDEERFQIDTHPSS
jgi:hypothetical protein